VVGAELLQALGAVTYVAARGVAAVAVAAVLPAAGQQLFYSSLFTLIADVAGDGPKDRPFTVAAMVRSACSGLGGLAAGGLLSLAGATAYRIAAALPPGWRPAGMLAATAVLAAAGLLFQTRVNALAGSLAPPAARGRYLAGHLPAGALRPGPGMAVGAVSPRPRAGTAPSGPPGRARRPARRDRRRSGQSPRSAPRSPRTGR
jgi:hypothetical protein